MLRDGEIVQVTKETARSLDLYFKYRKGDKNITYVPELDALVGNPIPAYCYLVKKAQEVDLSLTDQEHYKIVHLKAWYEAMHGCIYRKIGASTPFRRIVEDYWLYKRESEKFGREKYSGYTLNLWLDRKEVNLSLLERINNKGHITQRIASLVALLLFFHNEKRIQDISKYWGNIKKFCESVEAIRDIKEVTPKIREILTLEGITETKEINGIW